MIKEPTAWTDVNHPCIILQVNQAKTSSYSSKLSLSAFGWAHFLIALHLHNGLFWGAAINWVSKSMSNSVKIEKGKFKSFLWCKTIHFQVSLSPYSAFNSWHFTLEYTANVLYVVVKSTITLERFPDYPHLMDHTVYFSDLISS